MGLFFRSKPVPIKLHHGVNGLIGYRTKVHKQCRETRQETSPFKTFLQSCNQILKVMMKHGYIGEFEVVDDHRGGKIVVNLTGRLNKVGVISPRFDVGVKDIEKWTNNLLPSRQFGYIV